MTFTFPADVEGYAGEPECRELYNLACQTPREGVIVELGTYKGRTAISMAQSGRTVFAVDRFQPEWEEFTPLPDHRAGNFSKQLVEANAERYGVDVRVIEADTFEAAFLWRQYSEQTIDMLFIDAGHEYENVHLDTVAWASLLNEDGILVFDDSLWPGVQRVILSLTAWTPIPGPQIGGLTAMKRIKETVNG